MESSLLNYHFTYLSLIQDYQLDIHSLPIQIKDELESIEESLKSFNQEPTSEKRKKIILKDEAICNSITNWVEELCKVLEG